MKVTLNLSTSAHTRERVALAWAVPAVVIGLAGLFYLGVSTLRAARDYRDVHRSVAELEERLARMKEHEVALKRDLERPQYRELLRNVQFVNQLIEKKQLTLTDLAARVAKLLPGKVRLNGLTLAQQQDGSYLVRFTLTGQSEEAVENFVGNLEDSSEFKDVTIANQGFEQEGGAAGPVNIACTARYVPEEH